MGGVEEQELIDLWLNAITDERVVKKRDGKKAKKKGGRWDCENALTCQAPFRKLRVQGHM